MVQKCLTWDFHRKSNLFHGGITTSFHFSTISSFFSYVVWYWNWSGCGDGSVSKFLNPGQVGSNFCCSGWVSHLWFGFGKFPLKIPNFSIFHFRWGQKEPWSKMGRLLFNCGSKVCSDWVRDHLYLGGSRTQVSRAPVLSNSTLPLWLPMKTFFHILVWIGFCNRPECKSALCVI